MGVSSNTITSNTTLSNAAILAAREYLSYSRNGRPEGKFDSGGRWWPDESEIQVCCNEIRQPSRRFPFSLYRHCRSIKHVANKHCADIKEVRLAIRLIDKMRVLEI